MNISSHEGGLPLVSVPLPKSGDAQICGLWPGVAGLPGWGRNRGEMADPEPPSYGPESHSPLRPRAPLLAILGSKGARWGCSSA